jgi:xanthine/uracil permease
MTRPPDLIYAVDEDPPWVIMVVSALQHIGVMAITLIFPIIIAREANLSGTQFLDLVSLSMFGLGVANIAFACDRASSAPGIFAALPIRRSFSALHCSRCDRAASRWCSA